MFGGIPVVLYGEDNIRVVPTCCDIINVRVSNPS